MVPDVRVSILFEERRDALVVTMVTHSVQWSEPCLLWDNTITTLTNQGSATHF